MKIDIILNSTDQVLIASRYKYSKLLKQIYGDEIKIVYENKFNEVIKNRPKYCIVFGSFRKTYKFPLIHKIPYILCEHDIVSLYRQGESLRDEMRKVRNAKKIIFTSEEHQHHIIKKYNYPKEKTMVLYLRPSKEDLIFKPLEKLPGKNLVYIGGLLDNSMPLDLQGRFSYRCYADIFKSIMDQGWSVHLYPARKRPDIYHKIGCKYHQRFAEGKELFQQLSQYTAGLQGFNYVSSSFNYAATCRPNKIWNYLAGEIPTIGINPGNGKKLYENKWGYELKDIEKINTLDFDALDLEKYRQEQTIEQQQDELKNFIES